MGIPIVTSPSHHYVSFHYHSVIFNNGCCDQAISRSVFLARPVGDHGKWATGMMKKLLLVSAIPARALYHAANAAKKPKRPPALRVLA